jgi:hypothetical protein
LILDLTLAIGYNASMLNVILANVGGSISKPVCEVLEKLVSKVPSNGAVLDINCGEGRSTLVLAAALEARGKDAPVMAVDTHITNPFSDTPYQEGTVLKFLVNARRFHLAHKVVPLICAVDVAGRVLGKRAANLVVIQSPMTVHSVFSADAVTQAIGIGKAALRSNGAIAVVCPNPACRDEFNTIASSQFRKGYTRIVDDEDIKVFETSCVPVLSHSRIAHRDAEDIKVFETS